MSKINIDKKIKLLIIMMSILLIIIVSLSAGILLINNKRNISNTNNNQNQAGITNSINNETFEMPKDGTYENITYASKIDNNVKYVENRSDYFTISSLVSNYIEMIGYQNKTKLNAILSPDYMSKYNVTDGNIFKQLTVPTLDNSRQYYKFRVNNMLTSQIDDTTHIYIVNGSCRVVGKNTIFSIKVMIELDTVSKLYNIYPYQYIEDNGIDKIKVGERLNNYNKEEITDRDLNKFNYVTITDKELANKYFEDFKEMILYYKDETYNKLNTEYSKNRFGNKKEFENYLEYNSNILRSMQINEYTITYDSNYTDFICTDQYDNQYIFRQQDGIMRYSILLDNYTIKSASIVEEYSNANKRDKAKYQLDTLVKKLNTKDYKSIYNSLDETFKNNNFKTLDEFKKYTKKSFYDINGISVKEYNEKNGYSVFDCELSNLSNSNERKKMTVIIDIKDNMNFIMSFSFN